MTTAVIPYHLKNPDKFLSPIKERNSCLSYCGQKVVVFTRRTLFSLYDLCTFKKAIWRDDDYYVRFAYGNGIADDRLNNRLQNELQSRPECFDARNRKICKYLFETVLTTIEGKELIRQASEALQKFNGTTLGIRFVRSERAELDIRTGQICLPFHYSQDEAFEGFLWNLGNLCSLHELVRVDTASTVEREAVHKAIVEKTMRLYKKVVQDGMTMEEPGRSSIWGLLFNKLASS